MSKEIKKRPYQRLELEEGCILAIPWDVDIHENQFSKLLKTQFTSLKNKVKRDSFEKHAYNCLPLVMGNQYGFVLKSLIDFSVIWNGGEDPQDVTVYQDDEALIKEWEGLNPQQNEAHFGMGTFTIQTPFTFRTPENINLMICNPPNYFKDGVQSMTAVVETDYLRRDFSFTLKLTRPYNKVNFKKGEPLACILPYPRNFIDKFSIQDARDVFSRDFVRRENLAQGLFGAERKGPDQERNRHRSGYRYRKGVDIYGSEFPDHQSKFQCPFASKKKK